MTARVRARFLLLVPILAACATAETEEQRAQRLAVEAAQHRNAAAGAAIALILVTAYGFLRSAHRPIPAELPWPAVGALAVNEVVASVLVATVGVFAGVLLGPEPPRPDGGVMIDRDLERFVGVLFLGPYVLVVGMLGSWLRGAPRRIAAGRRRARLWLGAVHGVLAGLCLWTVVSSGGDAEPLGAVLAVPPLATVALLVVDDRLARRRAAASGWGGA